ncbi:4-phosphoerythronate dehydrogenase [Neptunicella marina]|uniref:Erythronate-4-phosphate dehydrogenase n=1 Tax=Neptunicella marina TaxID=2125989 RepID=A0A8J6ISC5_9ALTE|nr:4-phosphoerythronate dehydrogenase [Neptunicella marina]MBC3764518.1 4-phosphoerythronate dehydrogenase [Neptunicella marina]
MKIYYEDSMPYAERFFSQWGECQAFSGKTVTPAQIADAGMLFVRSTTKVNQALIGECKNLKFVATATAGFNHIDIEYLNQRNIPYYVAAGCNSVSVAEYVVSCLCELARRYNWHLPDKTVGIVGAGQAGSALARKLDALGMRYLLCDPPKLAEGDPRSFVDMDAIMQCDIISLHVPLVTAGEHPTQHLFDAKRLAELNENQLLINACRGEVLDNNALLALYQQGAQRKVVLDVWENEPDIVYELIPYVDIATAHIAGHSVEGKANGTEMVYQAAAKHFSLPNSISLQPMLPQPEHAVIELSNQPLDWSDLYAVVKKSYDVALDDKTFRNKVVSATDFEYIRKNYAIRREFAALQVNAGNCALSQAIYGLGFSAKP